MIKMRIAKLLLSVFCMTLLCMSVDWWGVVVAAGSFAVGIVWGIDIWGQVVGKHWQEAAEIWQQAAKGNESLLKSQEQLIEKMRRQLNSAWGPL